MEHINFVLSKSSYHRTFVPSKGVSICYFNHNNGILFVQYSGNIFLETDKNFVYLELKT